MVAGAAVAPGTEPAPVHSAGAGALALIATGMLALTVMFPAMVAFTPPVTSLTAAEPTGGLPCGPCATVTMRGSAGSATAVKNAGAPGDSTVTVIGMLTAAEQTTFPSTCWIWKLSVCVALGCVSPVNAAGGARMVSVWTGVGAVGSGPCAKATGTTRRTARRATGVKDRMRPDLTWRARTQMGISVLSASFDERCLASCARVRPIHPRTWLVALLVVVSILVALRVSGWAPAAPEPLPITTYVPTSADDPTTAQTLANGTFSAGGGEFAWEVVGQERIADGVHPFRYHIHRTGGDPASVWPSAALMLDARGDNLGEADLGQHAQLEEGKLVIRQAFQPPRAGTYDLTAVVRLEVHRDAAVGYFAEDPIELRLPFRTERVLIAS